MRQLAAIALMMILCACGPDRTGYSGDDGAGASNDAGGGVDATPDGDHDGYGANVDCDDDDASINPGAPELCGDGADNNCDGFTDADDFACLPPCERAVREQSYFGCEFYAVDLPQFNTDKLYGIIVSNPSEVDVANVTISTAGGVVWSMPVAPRGLQTYEVANRTQNVLVAGTSNLAYRIESDQPIAAYQFNSLDTIGAASTDASLLFAEHSLAKLYFAMDYTSRAADDGFISVVATEPDTVVTVTPSAAVSGATSGTLQPMQVLTVTSGAAGVSLSGSRVEASAPVAVFSGNRCTNVPAGMSYCDHVEQQIFPRQAIGTRYVVGKTHARAACSPPDYVRIMADDAATTVTLDPPIDGPWTLDAGQWVEVMTAQSLEISADKPIMVGQFMRSSNGSECDDEGDPAFILQVPVDQYRRDYIFLTPPTYDTDYVDILAPLGATVTLDGAPVALDPTPIGATAMSLTSVVVGDGPHAVAASEPVGVMVYGYGGPGSLSSETQNVSYGYPAGLDLAPINPIE